MIAVTTRITKSGKEITRATFSSGRKFRVGKGGLTFGAARMARLAIIGEGLIKARTAKGIGSDDAPMKPLATRYAKWKSKIGKGTIRDLRGPGTGGTHLMESRWLRYADESMARLDITRRLDRIKARSNERRDPWFGWSPNDVTEMRKAARILFSEVVGEFELVPTGDARRSLVKRAHPWLDPLNYQSAFKAA